MCVCVCVCVCEGGGGVSTSSKLLMVNDASLGSKKKVRLFVLPWLQPPTIPMDKVRR